MAVVSPRVFSMVSSTESMESLAGCCVAAFSSVLLVFSLSGWISLLSVISKTSRRADAPSAVRIGKYRLAKIVRDRYFKSSIFQWRWDNWQCFKTTRSCTGDSVDGQAKTTY